MVGCEKDLSRGCWLSDGERDHKPRNVDSPKKVEKAKKQILPKSFQKGTQLCQHLDFSHRGPRQTSEL